jgi:hypothetical protein
MTIQRMRPALCASGSWYVVTRSTPFVACSAWTVFPLETTPSLAPNPLSERSVHVALDLRLGQRAVVDPDFVDDAVEPVGVPAELPDVER